MSFYDIITNYDLSVKQLSTNVKTIYIPNMVYVTFVFDGNEFKIIPINPNNLNGLGYFTVSQAGQPQIEIIFTSSSSFSNVSGCILSDYNYTVEYPSSNVVKFTLTGLPLGGYNGKISILLD